MKNSLQQIIAERRAKAIIADALRKGVGTYPPRPEVVRTVYSGPKNPELMCECGHPMSDHYPPPAGASGCMRGCRCTLFRPKATK